mgnify:CR=1 FL=1
MHFFVKATLAPQTERQSIRWISTYVAVFFVALATTQLFAYENFPGIIASFGLPLNDVGVKLVAALIVISEIFAIPFLLRMKLSPLMRIISLKSGWIVLLFWLVIGIWQNTVDFKIPNTGLFGSEIILPCGWWTISFITIFIVLMVYSTIGLWPFGRIHHRAKK